MTRRGSSTDPVKLPPHVRRIAFTCDVARLGRAAGGLRNVEVGNLQWLEALVTRTPLWSSVAVDPRIVVPPSDQAALRDALGDARAWDEYLADPEAAWARRFDAAEPGIFPALLDDLARCDLVVGFELPPSLKRSLQRRQRPYLSLHIDPLRFLRDLCLGATTNCVEIAAALEAEVVPPQELADQVGRFKAQFRRLGKPAFAFPPDVPVLVGQTERDSVLIERGTFCRWDEHIEQLDRLLGAHDTVVFLEHPLRRSSAAVAQVLRSRSRRHVISTNANSYGVLFANPRIPLVVTLASSLGVEAQALGLRTEFLLGHPRARLMASDVDLAPPQPLGHGVLSDDLWARLLGRERPARRRAASASPPAPFALGDNYLRTSLESWSYRIFQGAAQGITRKVLLPRSRLEPARLDRLVDELLGTEVSALSRLPDGGRNAAVYGEHGLDLRVGPTPIAVGESRSVDVTDPWDVHQLEGFGDPEGWGVWLTGDVGRIRIALAPETAKAGARVVARLGLTLYEPLLQLCPVVRISVDGEPCAEVFYRPSGPQPDEVCITFDTTDALPTIELVCSDALSPAEVGTSADHRALSIALRSLHIACTARPGAGGRSGRRGRRSPSLWGICPQPVDAATPAMP